MNDHAKKHLEEKLQQWAEWKQYSNESLDNLSEAFHASYQDNSKANKHIDERLEQWARWFDKRINTGLGYPSKSVIALFLEGVGIMKEKNFKPKPLPTNEAAEEVEQYVKEMAEQNLKMANVLRKYYLGKERTVRSKAASLGISETLFKRYLAMARQWLIAKLL